MSDQKPPEDADVEEAPDVEPTTEATPAEETLPDDDNPIVEQPDDEPPLAAEADSEADVDAVSGEEEPAPAVDKARRAKRPLSGAALAASKKKADRERREVTIAEVAENTAPPDEALVAEDERRTGLMAEMEELDAEAQEHDKKAKKCRKKIGKLLLSMYPQAGPNDPHHKAVRGYLEASAAERQNRALAPSRLKAMLVAAGKAPIDHAFSRKAARGMNRPQRKLATQEKPAAQDQAPGGTPDGTAAAAAE